MAFVVSCDRLVFNITVFIIVLTVIFSPAGVASPETPLDFEGANPALDIDVRGSSNDKLGADVAQIAGLAFRDHILYEQFGITLRKLGNEILEQISGKRAGYLLRLRLYVDQFGTPEVPGGQLIELVGPGKEPLEALAEEIRTGTYRAGTSSLRDASSYVWVRERNGKFVISPMPNGFREAFEANALREADRVDLLAQSTSDSSGTGASLRRAGFWNEVAQRHMDEAVSEEHKRLIGALTKQYAAAEANFNHEYSQFMKLSSEWKAQNERAALLEQVAGVLNVLEKATKAGELFSPATGADVREGGATGLSTVTEDLHRTKEQQSEIMDAVRRAVPEVNASGERLRRLEFQIHTEYLKDKIAVPSHDPVLVPEVELPH